MRMLEQRIVENGEASVSKASLVEMQQVTSYYPFWPHCFSFSFQICVSYFSL